MKTKCIFSPITISSIYRLSIATFSALPALLLFCVLHIFSPSLSAQTISGVVNSYAKVTALDTCDQKLTVSNVNGSGFVVGATVLVIQMNGASMAEENNDTYGTLQDLRGAGKYEFNVLDSVSSNVYYLRYRTLYAYNIEAAIQVIALPTLTNAIISDTVRPRPWDGSTGGVVVVKANQITFNAPINANATGFRASTASNAYHDCTYLENPSDFFYNLTAWQGAPKGEGINIMTANKESGRGAQTNGGGGGNSHKTGGGGGGNVRSGGSGGSNNDGGFYCRGNNPGVGGKPITLTNDRVFMGGGGGGAHVNNSSASSGGNGGGIVIVSANTIVGNNQFITANGSGATTNDSSIPGSGGGAGGTIVVDAATVTGLLALRANGGAGGSIVNNSGRCQGTGGGGAGGRTMSNNASVTRSVVAGAAGVANGGTCNGSTNGATAGETGVNTTLTGTFLAAATASIVFYRTLTINTEPSNQSGCEGKMATLTIVVTGSDIRYTWQIDNGNGIFTDLTDNAFYAGSNTATLTLRNLQTAQSAFRYRCLMTTSCNGRTTATSRAVSVAVTPRPIPSFTFSLGVNTNVAYFINTSTNATRYIWSFGDGNTSSALSPNNTYLVQGTYAVTLSAINGCDTITTTQRISVNTLPLANFSANTTDYCIPASVTYINQASPNTTGWQWTFPGGTPATSTAQNPTVQYTQAGTYDVLLVATNPSGRDTLWRRTYIRVNGIPVPSFTYLRNGSVFSFNNPTTGATGFNWNFGDGQVSTQVNPQHVFASSGTYIITLRATNACGTATYTDTLLLLNTPTAIVSSDRSKGCVPMAVQFNGQNSTNVSSWQWTLTGGTPATSTAQNPRIVYNTPGVFRVQLTVRNSVGQNTTTLDSFIVVEATPIANFSATVRGNEVTLRNLSSGANNYRWDYGDGMTANRNDLLHTYLYRFNGLYSVSLLALNTSCGTTTTQQVPVNYVATEETAAEKNALVISPNPTTDVLHLHFATPTNNNDQIQLRNIAGQLLEQWTLNGETDFNIQLAHLPSGVYVLQYLSGDTRRVRRVVKW